MAAVLTGGVLLGAVACGGSSTVEAPTTAADGGGTSSGPTTLPATAPASSSAASTNPKDAAFVAKMKSQGLVASDSDILGAAGYVCSALSQNPNKQYQEKTLPTLVKAMIGTSRTGGGVSAEQADKLATADATKLIAEAKTSYCKA
ncbi:hypothetical protein AXK60_14715 [Tsukamurella pseudospumae]|uniref:DUF732 domain-containing protein n=1 Tax=Tsukamurella pseudospumae TaxID=239498 RepID=A0A137ZY48_9ACTN|nr:hypothetical protein AXK61_19380 [Tsukamurella pseudospumae]KXP03116.1 hypothetical protein AXK60_14715 [Tsukamurella pseudospumae]